MPLDNRQIQLDSEALQRLMLAQPNVTQVQSPVITGQDQPTSASPGAKSPLAQAMLQIHSPDSSPELGMGETVVLQMEEGRATLVAQPSSIVKTAISTNGDSDDVFEKREDNQKTEAAKTTLHSVISNLITAHTLREEAERIRIIEKAKNEVTKPSVELNNTPSILSTSQSNVSPGSKGGNSPSNQKSGEIVVPRPGSAHSNGSVSSGSSPGPALPVERKKSTSRTYKAPHPAFPIPSPTFDQFGKSMYNYNLPDRGLGTLMSASKSSVPHSTSPPTVSLPRFQSPAQTAVTGQSGQILGFIAQPWSGTRPLSQSSASSDSRSTGSPLDLSSVKDISNNINKVRQDLQKEVSFKPKLLGAGKSIVSQQVHQPPFKTNLIVPTLPSAAGSVSEKELESTQLNGQDQDSKQSVTKPPYVREMLYLFDKELEIISVAKNKWIVRNENELTDLVKEKLGEGHRQSEVKSNAACEKCQNCAKTDHISQTENGIDKADTPKRQYEMENSDQRSKVTKLTNGDVHESPGGKDLSEAKRGEWEEKLKASVIEENMKIEEDSSIAPEAVN